MCTCCDVAFNTRPAGQPSTPRPFGGLPSSGDIHLRPARVILDAAQRFDLLRSVLRVGNSIVRRSSLPRVLSPPLPVLIGDGVPASRSLEGSNKPPAGGCSSMVPTVSARLRPCFTAGDPSTPPVWAASDVTIEKIPPATCY